MNFRATHRERDSRPRSSRRTQPWALWSIKPRGRAFLLGTELLAVLAVAVLLRHTTVTSLELSRFAFLAVLSVGYTEVTDRLERIRRYLGSDQVWANQVSVWAFAGALVLPAAYAALLVVLMYGHTLLLGRRHRSIRPHRVVFGAATVVFGTLSASAVLNLTGHGILGSGAAAAAGIVGSLLAFTGVSLAVMLLGAYLSVGSFQSLLPGTLEIMFEFATLILGVITATFLTRLAWFTPSVLLVLAVLHRSTLVKQLQVLASTDAKTGLLNPVVWKQLAEKVLQRRGRVDTCAAVLLLDLDHFKSVNDTHGHQVGDSVIRAVAEALKHELRGYDAVSRYGGEEFIAFLDDVAPATALGIAERVRHRISTLNVKDGLRITASIGVALTAGYGNDIDSLVAAADSAMYAAKHAGRNRIQCALPAARTVRSHRM